MHEDSDPHLSMEEVRSWFPGFHAWAYLDFAGVAIVPQVCVDAVTATAERQAVDGVAGVEAADAQDEETRAAVAAFVGAGRDEICFVRNTTEGLGWVTNGLDLEPGDRVVAAGGEFPSAHYPWALLRERGVVVDLVEPEPRGGCRVDRFADVITSGPPPALVAASWVRFDSGWRTDLHALGTLAHEHGALFAVDVIQGVGAIPLDLGSLPVDFAAADGHKWLCSLEGQGFLYVSRHALGRLRPLEPGWNSVVHRTEWTNLTWVPDPGARRLEGGTATRVGIAGLGASVRLLSRMGRDRTWRRIRELGGHAAAGLEAAGMEIVSPLEPGHESGIVTFRHPRHDAAAVVAALRESRVVVAGPRCGGVRVSPHAFCTEEDVDRLLRSLPR